MTFRRLDGFSGMRIGFGLAKGDTAKFRAVIIDTRAAMSSVDAGSAGDGRPSGPQAMKIAVETRHGTPFGYRCDGGHNPKIMTYGREPFIPEMFRRQIHQIAWKADPIRQVQVPKLLL